MTIADMRSVVLPGDGVVAAFGGGAAVVVALPGGDAEEAFVDRLLSLVEASVADDTSAPGRRLARRLAGVLADAEPSEVPSFGVLAGDGDDVVALLHGAVDLEAEGEQPLRLSGTDVATWVDRLLRAPTSAVVRPAGSSDPPRVDGRSDLRAGVVRGSGVALVPRDAVVEGFPSPAPPVGRRESTAEVPLDAAPTSPEPPVPVPQGEPDDDATIVGSGGAAPSVSEEVPFTVVSLEVTEEELEEREPLPVPGGEPAEEERGPVVDGVLCSRGHLNDPNALYCSVCGISMVQQTHNLVKGRRPPLGVLVLDDGATFALDCNYVIGREPEDAPEVTAGRANPLRLDDPQRTLSRVHAHVSLEGWEVRVGDARSSNGTFLAAPGDATWSRLPPDGFTTIRPGSRILVGHRVLVFDSHHRA